MNLDNAMKMIEGICSQLKLSKDEHRQVDLALETIKQALMVKLPNQDPQE